MLFCALCAAQLGAVVGYHFDGAFNCMGRAVPYVAGTQELSGFALAEDYWATHQDLGGNSWNGAASAMLSCP